MTKRRPLYELLQLRGLIHWNVPKAVIASASHRKVDIKIITDTNRHTPRCRLANLEGSPISIVASLQPFADPMKFQRPIIASLSIAATSAIIFVIGGHFAATRLIETQQAMQLRELGDVALRRAEMAVDFGAAT